MEGTAKVPRMERNNSVCASIVLVVAVVAIAGCQQSQNSSTPETKGASGNQTQVADAKAIERGRVVFERVNCQGCHPGGENTGNPTKPIKGPEFAGRYADDKVLESRVRSGGPGGMPSFDESEINAGDMKDLIAYIRSLTPAHKKSE